MNDPYGVYFHDIPNEDIQKVKEILVVGMRMTNKHGLFLPFHLPPAVAYSILQWSRGEKITYNLEGGQR